MCTFRAPLIKFVYLFAALCLVITISAPASQSQTPSPELRVAFSIGPESADPRFANNLPGQSILRHVYEPLLYHDDSGKLIPVLAQSWKFINPTTVEFKLRRGIRFTNGEDFDSQSVAYTLRTILAPNSGASNRSAIAAIDKIETPDKYTVRISTRTPSRPLLRALTFTPLGLMPPKASQELGKKVSSIAIGTGPYKMVDFTPGQQVVLEANSSYWGRKPSYSKIVFKIIPDNGARLAALRSGDVVMINNLPPDDISLIRADPNLLVSVRPSARMMFIALNMSKPIMKDIRMRQALNYAINRSQLVTNILHGMTTVATGPFPPITFSAAKLPAPQFDLAKAKESLRAAGYKNEPLEFFVPNGRYISDKQIGEAIAGYFQDAGLNVNSHVTEWGQFASEVFGGHGTTWDMAFLGWGITTYDPDFFVRDLFYSPDSFEGYKNATVDQLIAQGAMTVDNAKASMVYQELQRTLWNDVPMLFLYTQPQIDAISKRLKGYAPKPDELIYFGETRLQ